MSGESLNIEVCQRARVARDARFDGKFFIAVRTTGIYCRPVCPAPACKESNVRYYGSAAAAEAGFRPCLRCRPEASPGTPAWLGTPATVSRALKLIHDSALDSGSVEDLCRKLSVGSRHLRRLFLQHLGATPVAVAQTRRVHFAKRLIDDTTLPMTEVAMASGFGSLRRFNDTFRELYGRAPSELRRARATSSRAKQDDTPGHYRFELAYRPPYDWASLIEFLGARATPGLEVVTADRYERKIWIGDSEGRIGVERCESRDALELRVWFPESSKLFQIVEKVRRIFDLGADPALIAERLGASPALSNVVSRYPGLRVPGCWDDFELTVRAVLGQQVSVKAATTLAGRLVDAFGHPRAHVLADAPIEKIGLPSKRAQTIRDFAARLLRDRLLCPPTQSSASTVEAVVDRAVCPEAAPDPWDDLTSIRGIGPWTASYIAMRRGDPDAFPAGDLYLKPHAGESEAWRPWRAYAAMYLWKLAGEKATEKQASADKK